MKHPGILSVLDVTTLARGVSKNIGGAWVPCRPLGFPSLRSRVSAAWLVFTGRADALVWPGGQ